jgi:hypothetical protein
LPDCTKDSPYVVDAFALKLNGVTYPNFATVAANGIDGQVLKDGPSGTVVTATFSIAGSPTLATIIPCQMTQGTTAALDCERLYWSCWAKDGTNLRTPLCYGYIQVRSK